MTLDLVCKRCVGKVTLSRCCVKVTSVEKILLFQEGIVGSIVKYSQCVIFY